MSENHGDHLRLDNEQKMVLLSGIRTLMHQVKDLKFKPFKSSRYPLPITQAVYGRTPKLSSVIKYIKDHAVANPVSVLEQVLVLVELYESNQPDRKKYFIDDAKFLSHCFGIKRCNGWAYQYGRADQLILSDQINKPWQFRLYYSREEAPTPFHVFRLPRRNTDIYYLLNMLFRYAFIYGRFKSKESHAISHFIEDFGPGVLVCFGDMTDLHWTLALAAMKMGVPALVPPTFPFKLGRKIVYQEIRDIVDGITQFPNIRKLLDVPGITQLPDYCDYQHTTDKFKAETIFGDTKDSFYHLNKGTGVVDGIEIEGTPKKSLGVLVAAEHPRLEAIDCIYIESTIINALSRIKGIRALKKDGKLVIQVGKKYQLEPDKIGEVLQKALKHEFPNIEKVRVHLIFDEKKLKSMVKDITQQRADRAAEAGKVNEDTISEFYYCVGCSPFAPDHVCVLTPDRIPQCNRPFMLIRTGALFGYDDMSNIHHRILHKDINSFGVLPKGECLDPLKGEWTGINEHATKLSGGRTPKVFLHTLFDHPTTGCGCFGIIMFHIPAVDGIGIMQRGFEGQAPDGRTWLDLKYELAGKQTSGVSGCAAGYFASPKFLQGDGGWQRVVWVTKNIWDLVKDRIPEGHKVTIEEEATSTLELKQKISL